MRTLLESGTTLIVDRYAYSEVSFTAAKEVREINICVNNFKKSPGINVRMYFYCRDRGGGVFFYPVCHYLHSLLLNIILYVHVILSETLTLLITFDQ